MYWQVTKLVDAAVDSSTFEAGEFLARLDVHFANRFFEAYAADLDGTKVSAAWAPLFEGRARDHTLPIQFALAGMNAHISHDLPLAVVDACVELGKAPMDESPEHHDFTRTNDVLAVAQEEIKSWFSTGVIATVDQLGGRVDDGFAAFGIHLARPAPGRPPRCCGSCRPTSGSTGSSARGSPARSRWPAAGSSLAGQHRGQLAEPTYLRLALEPPLLVERA
jgi:hypothetical protein